MDAETLGRGEQLKKRGFWECQGGEGNLTGRKHAEVFVAELRKSTEELRMESAVLGRMQLDFLMLHVGQSVSVLENGHKRHMPFLRGYQFLIVLP